MKKLTILTTCAMILMSLLLQGQAVFAQSLTNVPGAVVSGQPTPTGGGSTTGTRIGGATGTSTGGTAGTKTTGITGTRANLPTPTDIPVVPALTQETTTPQDTTLVCDQDKCAATLNQAMGNEIIVMTILFFGSIAGGILWILGLLMMKKGVVERESRRMERQNRTHLRNVMTKQKVSVYNDYINTVIKMVDTLKHKNPVDKKDLNEFNEGSVFIDLHGSQHLRAMNEHIRSLIQGTRHITDADQMHLKSELSKTIRADLI